MDKKILDVCCGSRMFWFDKSNSYTVYMVFTNTSYGSIRYCNFYN